MGIGSILTREWCSDVDICNMSVGDFDLRKMESEGHGFDFRVQLGNGEPMAVAVVAVVVAVAMVCDLEVEDG